MAWAAVVSEPADAVVDLVELFCLRLSVCVCVCVLYMRACTTRQTRESSLRVWQCLLLVSAWRSLRTDRAAPCCCCRWERLPCLDDWDACTYYVYSRVSWDDFMDGFASGLSARQHASSIVILPASVRWFCCAATGRARVRCRFVCWKVDWDTDGRQKRQTALRCEVVLPERLDVPADFLSALFRVERRWVGAPVPRLAVVVRYVGPSAVAPVHRCLTCNFQGQGVGGLCVCVCVCVRRSRLGAAWWFSAGFVCFCAVSRKLAATRKAVASRLACVGSEDGVRSWRYVGACVM